eukprot:CAMPEP_0194318120 /NCGR_PEP_ID=MMETSP0171-20130528/14763_1 /TAXON_ID=218684 /ORGANISM="Corethron pennatum, Strain L29A3" /LENGTH=134 /DNA_ID=CAMNT_0039074931 /DNA_START=37 /DNA_END=441 /DNA_ORIENTATION=+
MMRQNILVVLIFFLSAGKIYSLSASRITLPQSLHVFNPFRSIPVVPRHATAVASFALFTTCVPLVALADEVEIEIMELPPPYVPVIFAFVCLGGVAALTGSLGDIISEEATLGERSGARAKKEMERTRSSYFKK